ncbi:MAG: hypothetical protein ACHQEB_02805 [Chitinophagales bacterium]
MKRFFVLLLFFAGELNSVPVHAQYYLYNDKYYDSPVLLEFGGSVGLMNCLTDLGGKKGIGKGFIKDLNMKNSKPSFSIYATATWNDMIGLRLETTFGSIQAYDSILKSVAPSTFGRYERNLSFKSKITDIQLSIEVHPLFIFNDYSSTDNEPPKLSPYLLAGIGYFSFNPQAELDGKWYDLQPLHLEGQGFTEYPDHKAYSLHQVNIPIGIGARYEINSFLNARLELVHRILFTDYLDDVSSSYINPDLFASYLPPGLAAIAQKLYDRQGELNPSHISIVGGQRGNPKDKDAYFSFQLKIGIILGRPRK